MAGGKKWGWPGGRASKAKVRSWGNHGKVLSRGGTGRSVNFSKTPPASAWWGDGRGETGTRDQRGGWGRDPEEAEGQGEWQEWGAWREGVFSKLPPSRSPEANVEPTDPVPIKPNPTLSLSGGSAIALIVVTLVVIMSLVVLSVYTLIHDKRYLPSLTPIHSAAPRPRTRSAARRKPSQQPVPRSFKLISERMTLTPDGPIGLVSSQSGSGEHERVWVFFFSFQLCHLLAVRPWPSHFSPLCASVCTSAKWGS